MRSASSASASTRCRTRSRNWPSSACSTVSIRWRSAPSSCSTPTASVRRSGASRAAPTPAIDVPQFSIHRGHLQGVIHQAVRARLGEARIHTGHRLGAFTQDDGGVTAYFFDRKGSHRHTARGDVLIGADGIHSKVRDSALSERRPGALERRHAVARSHRVAGVSHRPLDDRRRRDGGKARGLSDRGRPARRHAADQLGGGGQDRRRMDRSRPTRRTGRDRAGSRT